MINITPIFNNASKEPLYLQLYKQFRERIEQGDLPAHTRLPSVRYLSRSSGVSKITVEAAYNQLLIEGYVESRPRSGFYVRQIEPLSIPKTTVVKTDSAEDQHAGRNIVIDFHGSRIDETSFPHSVWRRLTIESLGAEHSMFTFYGHPQGEQELRREIANYLVRARTAACTPDQIVIGSGTQQSISLLSIMLSVDHGKIAMEEPGYREVRHVFLQHGLEVVPIPLEEDGIDVEKLKQSGARAVYVTPSHQYPYGMVMPIAKRLKLLQWAKETGGIIIEDDYDGEFRYKVKPIPSLQGMDQHNTVVYMGTFSKSLSPAIRVNYLVLPQPLLDRYCEDFAIYSSPVARSLQRTLQLFMEKGFWERHIRKMRTIYQKKHAVLFGALLSMPTGSVKVLAESAGLHLVVEVKSGLTECQLVRLAQEVGVKVYPLSTHWVQPPDREAPKLLLGFGGLSEEQIIRGVDLLRHAWFGTRR